jgi:hypothetical protein
MEPHFQFINHASFLVRHQGVAVLCDPWVSGTAFADGWTLIDESVTPDWLAGQRITHIVFSHEHPDHFSPEFLNALPSGVRRDITVLFQKTRDKKLVKFCAKLGFTCVELEAGVPVAISPQFQVQIEPFDKYDSALLYRVADDGRQWTILNTNDCEFRTAGEFQRCLDRFGLKGELDLLVTQFSYACWFGGRAEGAHREAAAAAKLEQMLFQIRVSRPRLVVPFASFVFFSHQENFYHNDAITRPDAAFRAIEAEFPGRTRFMATRESAALGEMADAEKNRAAIEFWDHAYESALTVRGVSQPVSPPDLKAAGNDYAAAGIEFLKQRPIVFGYNRRTLPTLNVMLSDIGATVRFHALRGLFDLAEGGRFAPGEPCLVLSSAALLHALRHPWGWESIHVAGRFEVSTHNYYAVVMHGFFLGIYRNNNVSGIDMLKRILRSAGLRGSRDIPNIKGRRFAEWVLEFVLANRTGRS